MKKAILLCGMLLAVSASMASAAGLNLAWNTCLLDGGVQNKNFTCASNTGNHDMIGSFVLDAGLNQVNGNELVVDLSSASPTLVDWWRFTAVGTCRQASLSIAAFDGINGSCPDMFGGQASMNIAAYQMFLHGPSSGRILCVNAVQEALAVNLDGGTEYAIARWRVNSAKTVGAGACAGCTVPVCIVFNSANITTLGNLNNTRLTLEAAPGSNFITWQGGGGSIFCPSAVPTKNATWGAVKSLYR